jgi:hypothetical protein
MQEGGIGQGTYKEWAIINYPEELWTPHSKKAGKWVDLNFNG